MLLAILSLNKIVSWVTTAIWERKLCKSSSRRSWPSIRMAPSSMSWKRGNRLTIVVLPEPLLPTRATTSPRSTCRSIFCRVGSSASGYWKRSIFRSMPFSKRCNLTAFGGETISASVSMISKIRLIEAAPSWSRKLKPFNFLIGSLSMKKLRMNEVKSPAVICP